ncbi:MAG TPA: (d)CMP kinase [Gaiellales bacterium]|jgi:para-aminobenzoate synthetase
MTDPAVVEQIAGALLAAPARAGRTRVVAIDGRAGSGKSTLARALAERLAAPIVDLELIYPGWDGLEAGVELLVERVLTPLADEHDAQVPRYDWEAGRFGEPLLLEPPALLIVEGVGAGAQAAAHFTSTLVWVELANDERRRRAIARDGDVFAPHWQRWAAQEETHYARELTAARADLVL